MKRARRSVSVTGKSWAQMLLGGQAGCTRGVNWRHSGWNLVFKGGRGLARGSGEVGVAKTLGFI